MGGGGGEGVGDFRAKVWSMSGGPYCRPKHWRRNTAFAMLGVFLVCIPIAMKSAELEVYSLFSPIPIRSVCSLLIEIQYMQVWMFLIILYSLC